MRGSKGGYPFHFYGVSMNGAIRTAEERKTTSGRHAIKTVPLHEEIRRSMFASSDSAYLFLLKERFESSDNVMATLMAGHILEPRSRSGAAAFDPKLSMSPEVARLERRWGHLFSAF